MLPCCIYFVFFFIVGQVWCCFHVTAFACILETGWSAVFDEPVNSKPPTPCVAIDVGSSVWDASAPETSTPEEKGWAKFTDFQPFCW